MQCDGYDQAKSSSDAIELGLPMYLGGARSGGILGHLSRAIGSIVLGLKMGYPVCCVLNYSLDALLGIPSGLSRGELRSPALGVYVPCHFHSRVGRPLSRSECLNILRTGSAVEHVAARSAIQTIVNGKVIFSTHVPTGMSGVLLEQLILGSASSNHTRDTNKAEKNLQLPIG